MRAASSGTAVFVLEAIHHGTFCYKLAIGLFIIIIKDGSNLGVFGPIFSLEYLFCASQDIMILIFVIISIKIDTFKEIRRF